MAKGIFTRTVWLLGLISLFTDMASEMLYPVMPVYLESVGFSVVLIGLLEGLAEATAGLSKGYFGKWSDARQLRAPFVQAGYGLSALSKPLLAVWTAPLWVFFARTTDRLGKGIRTGARDAMLALEATPATKGRVFGFHRSMDTLGAAIGPLIALAFLHFHPASYAALFLLAFFPGLLAILATLFLKDKPAPAPDQRASAPGFFSFLRYLPQAGLPYRRLLTGLLAFALINSSDFFLLLLLKHRGVSDSALIGIYIFYNLVYALAAYPAGALADRWGMKRLFIAGLGLFAVVYSGMGFAEGIPAFIGLFFLYGLYAACTEGVAKAWISNVVDKADLGTAIGTYEGLRSITALVSSTLAGLIWYGAGPETLFLATGILAAGIAVYFWKRTSTP
ncbi:MAG TPA: MFS transporter [Flavilitoribacter sp.]|nr:MFS transporter [Flavilitoribacter sp.]